jgi:hypothetical protein
MTAAVQLTFVNDTLLCNSFTKTLLAPVYDTTAQTPDNIIAYGRNGTHGVLWLIPANGTDANVTVITTVPGTALPKGIYATVDEFQILFDNTLIAGFMNGSQASITVSLPCAFAFDFVCVVLVLMDGIFVRQSLLAEPETPLRQTITSSSSLIRHRDLFQPAMANLSHHPSRHR